jgi:hypothetical protein
MGVNVVSPTTNIHPTLLPKPGDNQPRPQLDLAQTRAPALSGIRWNATSRRGIDHGIAVNPHHQPGVAS